MFKKQIKMLRQRDAVVSVSLDSNPSQTKLLILLQKRRTREVGIIPGWKQAKMVITETSKVRQVVSMESSGNVAAQQVLVVLVNPNGD